MADKKVTPKEERFCQLYSVLGHPQEAVVGAGYPAQGALERFAALLSKDEVQSRCQQLVADHQGEAVIGLRRLAFSSRNDVVRLMTAEHPPSPEELGAMDLFCVSKIKQTKEGHWEVEFYDRLSALEALLHHKESAEEDGSIYEAIHRSAAAMEKHRDALEIS